MSDQQPAQSPPEDEKVPLLRVLEDLGTTLAGSEIPTPANVHQLVGAIVKVMQHGGVEVADELWPEEPAVVARPETADQVHRQKTNDRLDRLEGLLSDLHNAIVHKDNGDNGGDS